MHFDDVSGEAGIDRSFQANTHGAVFADFDLDGWVDVLTVSQRTYLFDAQGELTGVDDKPPKLYWNRSVTTGHHWLHVKLEGDPPWKVNQDAIGARVELWIDRDANGLKEDGEVLIREVQSGSSNNASTNSPILEFGLGNVTTVDTVTVEWLATSGSIIPTVVSNVPADRAIRITSGVGDLGDFCGSASAWLDKDYYDMGLTCP